MVVETKLYDLLGVAPDADEKTIRRAFRKMALKYHPDRNPDGAEMYTKISDAYEILKDADKRQIYDQYGEEGLKEGGPRAGGSPFDIFDAFMGGGGRGGRGRQGPRKNPPTKVQIQVSLEELYTGVERTVKRPAVKKCDKCSGSGARRPNAFKTCPECRGQGVVVEVVRMGPMIQQMQRPCRKCDGKGQTVSASDLCPGCRGQKVRRSEESVTFHIEAGMSSGDEIVLNGKGDIQDPTAEAGDLVFVVAEKPHPRFKRRGADLLYETNISLADAIAGARIVVKHLEFGRTVVVSPRPGQILGDQSILVAPQEGMRVGGSSRYGDLYILVNVSMPPAGSLDQSTLDQVAIMLGGKSAVSIPAKAEPCTARIGRAEDFGKNRAGERSRAAYDEDEEQVMGGQPQCTAA